MSRPEINPQIDPWKAIAFALEEIEDHYDRQEFLKLCLEGDTFSIAEEWPEFSSYVTAAT